MFIYIYIYTYICIYSHKYVYVYTYLSGGRRNHKRDIINKKSENLNWSRYTADECNHRVALKLIFIFLSLS